MSTWHWLGGTAMMPNCSETSGSFAYRSQLSVLVRPVLSPPWSVKPARGRALTVTSMPFQCSFWLP